MADLVRLFYTATDHPLRRPSPLDLLPASRTAMLAVTVLYVTKTSTVIVASTQQTPHLASYPFNPSIRLKTEMIWNTAETIPTLLSNTCTFLTSLVACSTLATFVRVDARGLPLPLVYHMAIPVSIRLLSNTATKRTACKCSTCYTSLGNSFSPTLPTGNSILRTTRAWIVSMAICCMDRVILLCTSAGAIPHLTDLASIRRKCSTLQRQMGE